MKLQQTIKSIVPQFIKEPVKNYLNDRKDRRALHQYLRKPWFPPPHVVKVRMVIEAAHRHDIGILVETGTFEGEMVRKCLAFFRRIYSIELAPAQVVQAAKRFSMHSHVSIIEGDSAKCLPALLESIDGRCLFWLDGHYSGGVTARGGVDTPIGHELKAIGAHSRNDHVILIDDARLLGKGDYPSFEELERMLISIDCNYSISVRDDIVVCEPPVAK